MNFIINKVSPSTQEDIKSNPPKPYYIKAQTSVFFPAGSYTVGTETYQYEGLTLPKSTYVDISRQKVIVETEVAGKRGRVREIISTDDWEITIRGVITTGSMSDNSYTDPYQYPHTEVMKLRNLFEVDREIEIVADIFSTIGVQRVVLKSLNLPSPENFACTQPFTITCVSDTPYELEIAQNGNDSTLSRDFQIYG